MSTKAELSEAKCEALFDLLELQILNPGNTINGLVSKITRCKAAMSEQDIAHVMKMIKELEK